MVFDVQVTKEPPLKGADLNPTWGGYRILFKTVSSDTFAERVATSNKFGIEPLW